MGNSEQSSPAPDTDNRVSKFKCVPIADISNETWNEWARSLEESNPRHSAEMLRYYDAFNTQGAQNLSFAVFDSRNELLALCPFSIYRTGPPEKSFIDASFSGTPCEHPAIRHAPVNERRRIARDVFGILDHACRQHGAQRIVLHRGPCSARVEHDPRPIFTLESLDHGYSAYPQTYLCIDLRNTEETLSSLMTAEHRKRIRQTARKGVLVQAFGRNAGGAGANEASMQDYFTRYRQAHFASAGRNTRPEQTWQFMMQYLNEGHATLFVSFLDHTPISFLYCGEFQRLALGWSQVNVEAYEVAYSPRHLLEWQAILHYRSRQFSFYEVGPRFKEPSLRYVPTAKEITISIMKERFGAEPWPDYLFEKYYDLSLQDAHFKDRYNAFRAAQTKDAEPLVAAPAAPEMGK